MSLDWLALFTSPSCRLCLFSLAVEDCCIKLMRRAGFVRGLGGILTLRTEGWSPPSESYRKTDWRVYIFGCVVLQLCLANTGVVST